MFTNQQYKLSGKIRDVKQLNAAIRRANCDRIFRLLCWVSGQLSASCPEIYGDYYGYNRKDSAKFVNKIFGVPGVFGKRGTNCLDKKIMAGM